MGETSSKPIVDLKDHQNVESFQRALDGLKDETRELAEKYNQNQSEIEEHSKRTHALLTKYAASKAEADCLCNVSPTLLWLSSSAKNACVDARRQEMSSLADFYKEHRQAEEFINFKKNFDTTINQLNRTIHTNKKHLEQ